LKGSDVAHVSFLILKKEKRFNNLVESLFHKNKEAQKKGTGEDKRRLIYPITRRVSNY